MKANELRIGNLVNLPTVDNSDSFHQISKRDFSSDYNSCIDIESMLPIPLTEEWLMKFGFEKKKHGSHHCWRKEDLIIDHLFYYCEMMYDGELECVIAIRHVHSLQNLYFALTGEELTT